MQVGMMRVFAIKLSDISRCPAGRLDVAHWNSDGTCKCGKRHPDAVIIHAASTKGSERKGA
jgi:hypothetical protein